MIDELFSDTDADGIADCVDTCEFSNLSGQVCTPDTPNVNSCNIAGGGIYNCAGVCIADPAPADPVSLGNECVSATNACGEFATGTLVCDNEALDGVTCNANVPANPDSYGTVCTVTGTANACGMTNTATGTILCDGSCSAVAPTAPANPDSYGTVCTVTGTANACGMTNTATGTILCDGSCSAVAPTAPANPDSYGTVCTVTGTANACGMTNTATGTILCDGSCSAVAPTAPANPDSYGTVCTVTGTANACGMTNTATGTILCDGSCSAVAPTAPANPDSDEDGIADCNEELDVSITKTAPSQILLGSSLTYTITYTNNSDLTIDAVNIVDQLPAGLQYSTSTLAPTAVSGNNYVWNIGSMNANQSASFTITVSTIGFAAYSNINNTIIITASGDMLETGNNVSSAVTSIAPIPNPGGGGGSTYTPTPAPVSVPEYIKEIKAMIEQKRMLTLSPFDELLVTGPEENNPIKIVELPKTGADQ